MTTTVVGAGIAGLVAARRRALGGDRVRLLEATAAPGGMIGAAQLGDLTIDIGAEAFAVRGGAVARLVDELGLAGDVVTPRPLGSWGFHNGEAYAQPKGGLLGIPPGPDAEGLAAAVGPEGVEAVRREAKLDPEVGADATSLGALVRARFGTRILDRLVAPVTRGVYSLDPDDVRVDALLPDVLERMRAAGSLAAVIRERRAGATPGALVESIRGGMHRLVAALVVDCERLGVELETGVRVTDLEALEGDVIVTVPPSAAFPYLGDAAAPAPVPTEVVALLLDAPALDARPRGTGLLVAPGSPQVRVKALTHVTAKWEWLDAAAREGRHVVRLSYPVDGAAPTDSTALADAATLLGIELDAAQLLDSARHTWQMPAPPAGLDGAAARAELERRVSALPPHVRCTGTWIAGTGLASVVPAAERAAG
ncbi:protoporphyrinogen/coproporphyrinogen oxidase [Gulosibacter faecalis]|uniref:protoporphyrinogen/coproporphyrinogen oxidase n=1 Tax=Gulosibacter faecalis TaxID=272240 RepID=UPI0003787289|nr:FAD-dependent oxidoreductase [Gulosibacter faecalis]